MATFIKKTPFVREWSQLKIKQHKNSLLNKKHDIVGSRGIARFSGVKLFENRIEYKNQTHKLDTFSDAHLDERGVTIELSDGLISLKCEHSQKDKAQKFILQVKNVALNYKANKDKIEKRLTDEKEQRQNNTDALNNNLNELLKSATFEQLNELNTYKKARIIAIVTSVATVIIITSLYSVIYATLNPSVDFPNYKDDAANKLAQKVNDSNICVDNKSPEISYYFESKKIDKNDLDNYAVLSTTPRTGSKYEINKCESIQVELRKSDEILAKEKAEADAKIAEEARIAAEEKAKNDAIEQERLAKRKGMDEITAQAICTEEFKRKYGNNSKLHDILGVLAEMAWSDILNEFYWKVEADIYMLGNTYPKNVECHLVPESENSGIVSFNVY